MTVQCVSRVFASTRADRADGGQFRTDNYSVLERFRSVIPPPARVDDSEEACVWELKNKKKEQRKKKKAKTMMRSAHSCRAVCISVRFQTSSGPDRCRTVPSQNSIILIR